MRSADASRCPRAFAGALVLLAVLTACSSMPLPGDKVLDRNVPDRAPAPAVAGDTAPSQTAATPAPSEPSLAERAAAILRVEAEVPPAAQRAFDAAREALRAGRVDEAERGFRALAKEHPEFGGPQANLGLIYRQSGKLVESATALEAAVKANPKQAAYANQLGITYRQQGEFKKAREAYETAIGLDPAYASAVLNLGILNDLYLWDGKRALELYERYLALKPGGDPVVSKWIADLKNRKSPPITVGRKEQP